MSLNCNKQTNVIHGVKTELTTGEIKTIVAAVVKVLLGTLDFSSQNTFRVSLSLHHTFFYLLQIHTTIKTQLITRSAVDADCEVRINTV